MALMVGDHPRYFVQVVLRRKVLYPAAGPDAYTIDYKAIPIVFGTKFGLTGKEAVQLARQSVVNHVGQFTSFEIIKWNGSKGETVASTPLLRPAEDELRFATGWEGRTAEEMLSASGEETKTA